MNFIGSKTIETERLILRKPEMEEQKKQHELLMIPEVNRYFLTAGKKMVIGLGKDKRNFMNTLSKKVKEKMDFVGAYF